MGNVQEKMIEVLDLHKYFGKLHVLKGVSTTIARGEVVAVMGPSGAPLQPFVWLPSLSVKRREKQRIPCPAGRINKEVAKNLCVLLSPCLLNRRRSIVITVFRSEKYLSDPIFRLISQT